MKPNTPDPIEQQSTAAMHRINQQINRSAGQHIRAVRRVRAGQPVVSEGTASAQRLQGRFDRVDSQQKTAGTHATMVQGDVEQRGAAAGTGWPQDDSDTDELDRWLDARLMLVAVILVGVIVAGVLLAARQWGLNA